ncbi:chromosome segregation protein SMC [Acidiferrobacter sp.]|uniref:chromosome segregation protein SMC n=1 Tax=Acidiferrobacter sp. TaxID=1872107 RepID=UPI0026368182|nr:chromosome segregation protein SMC [Acidiferrobacter sp.]
MRLKKIKLAGFKSFVDPTTVPVAANLVGIVGPNGCGKSNIIDAVRWVMGESSARQLRGDTLADVIFSGSTSRKPVSQASVELVFDNSEGRAAGEYARYAEIVVRREASRDGASDYFLNKTRCRRKDITDLFLGTGLGPRAYSIIEQGMISRIVEARPEDLRLFLEEAAGISRYKERRRETENRLRHVRENLARLDDTRGELDTQLNRLKRQAAAAQNYKVWRERERELRLILAGAQFRHLTHDIATAEAAAGQAATAVDAALARQRALEAETEAARLARDESNEAVRVAREHAYVTAAEVTRREQEVAHARALAAERRTEQQNIIAQCERLDREVSADQAREQALSQELEALVPDQDRAIALERAATEAQRSAETVLDNWRRSFEAAGLEAQGPVRASAAARSETARLAARAEDLAGRIAKLEAEAQGLATLAGTGLATLTEASNLADRDYEDAKERLTGLEERLASQRQALEAAAHEAAEQAGTVKAADARLASLRSVQAQALRTGHETLSRWLREHGLSQAPRLATQLDVDAGWERAIERWLGTRIAAVCVPAGTITPERVASLEKTPVVLFEPLASGDGDAPLGLGAKVRAPFPIAGLFGGVRPAASLAEALAERGRLTVNEALITPEGICVSRDVVSFAGENDERAGVLAREREIAEWTRREQAARTALEGAERARDEARAELTALEGQRAEARRALDRCADARTKAHGAVQRAHAEEQNRATRHSRLQAELEDTRKAHALCGAERERAQDEERRARQAAAQSEAALAALAGERETHQTSLEAARAALREASDKRHKLAMAQQQARTARDGVRERLTRARADLSHLGERREAVARQIEEALAKERAPQAELGRLLDERTQAQAALAAAEQDLEGKEAALRQVEGQRHDVDSQTRAAEEEASNRRLKVHELKVRRDALVEGLRAQGVAEDIAQRARELADEIEIEPLERELTDLGERIRRLGAVNLMAIEEFEEQSRRKEFLDAQHGDLSEALALLDEAIRKIDRETRSRFKETFERVNEDFKVFFPRLFGGGEAQLLLSSDDLLETGVTVMARPPGKRNSTIHLLSGGEKALVAVSLVFALFALNPAPFCFLDEVDAPLDEANVGRFAQTLKELAQKSQLLFITHNKVTMEAADVLLGVTTAEAGVSRLVSVDVEEALGMVVRKTAEA